MQDCGLSTLVVGVERHAGTNTAAASLLTAELGKVAAAVEVVAAVAVVAAVTAVAAAA